MEVTINKNSKITFFSQRSSGQRAVVHVKATDNSNSKQSYSQVKKEKLLYRASKERKPVSRESTASFSSKSGPESDFDLEDSGYLDVHLASVNKASGMSSIKIGGAMKEKTFRGLNYEVIGDKVSIRGETRQALLNGSEDTRSGKKVKDQRSMENVMSDTIESEDDTSSGTTRDRRKSSANSNGAHTIPLSYLQHRGNSIPDLHDINGDGLRSLRHTFGRLSTGNSHKRSTRSPLLLQSSRSSSQRDLSTTSSLCSDDSTEEHIDSETSRLNIVLSHIDPKRLHSHLQRKLKTADRSTILSLSTLLPRKKFTAETMHCVRCHQEFNPKYGVKTCTLFHPEDSVSKMFEDDTGADFECESCGTVFRTEGVWDYTSKVNKTIDCGFCFLGEHTYEAEDVDYHPDGIAKTCEDNGCVVFYV